MKQKLAIIFTLITTLITTLTYSQREASVWYFGNNAGIKFNNDGTVTALTDGQLNTSEGCASLADNAGNLLFYTDGMTIYNKNHQIMLNGTGLTGNWSTTQSATIVQKPGSMNLFYVFTLDSYAGANGFRYSIVDMNLDGGLGGVTIDKNILVYAPSSEKLAIVKHANNNDFWIVTHGWNNNNFYSYLLTSSGLNITPTISNIGTVISGSTDNVWGYMKISPDGSKLAVSNSLLNFELYDFNNTNGQITNQRVLFTGNGTYGVEFSPNSELLYTTIGDPPPYKILQYDLTATNIASSQQEIYNSTLFSPAALQLGPDGKIYIAEPSKSKLSVIENPNIVGSGCNISLETIDLAGRTCDLGLPPFVTSFFYTPYIQSSNRCLGDSTDFSINTSVPIINAIWDFGDGSPLVSDASPTHLYTASGNYTVTVTVTTSLGIGTNTQNITIYQIPTATQPQDILQCDSDNNGIHNFDLTSNESTILNGQNASLYTVRYFANATDYANNLPIATPSSYPNLVAYQQQTIIAEVTNNANRECKATTTFTIDVFDTPRPATSITTLTSCDNTSFGTDVDGRVRFDLTQRASTILNGQSASQFTIGYFQDAGCTIPIATPSNYVNTTASETIYIKVTNNDNLNCFATTSFTIEVFPLPTITNVVTLKQCDDTIDGYSVFNLTEANSLISANFANETFTFYELASEAQSGTNPILNPTTYTNQTVSNDMVFVRVVNTNGCFRVAQLNLNVSTTQIPLSFTRNFTVCDDAILGTNTDGISSFNFSAVTAQIQAIFPVGQLLIISYYRNLADALAERNAITDIANYRNIGYPNTQNIYIRVDSAINNDCLGLGQHITLNVERIPIIQPQQYMHCDDDQDGNYGFDTSTLQSTLLNGLTNVSVTYFDANNNPLPSPLPNPFVTTSQTIKAVVTNNTVTACNYQTTIAFVVDDLPEAFPINSTLTTVCDDEPNPMLQDGIYAFDTSSFQSTILGSQTGMMVNYYDQSNNPLPSPLPNPFVTTTQNVRVEVISPVNTTCKAMYIIPFVVNPVPKIDLNGNEIVCNQLSIKKTLEAGILDGTPTNDYTYIWKRNNDLLPLETNSTLEVFQDGTYTVEVTNSFNCSRTRTIMVVASDLATITNIYISDLSNDNTIVISVTGNGDYVYSLDNITFQASNTFEGVPAGVYNVYVKDLNGCGTTLPHEVNVLGIPSYFTPNGDGYNDYWNIKGISSTINGNTQIMIFDRLGKLLKQISPTSQGWDGTYLDQNVPATDYWYSIQLQDNRVIKGHFALKR